LGLNITRTLGYDMLAAGMSRLTGLERAVVEIKFLPLTHRSDESFRRFFTIVLTRFTRRNIDVIFE
jgi:hypothetical protein